MKTRNNSARQDFQVERVQRIFPKGKQGLPYEKRRKKAAGRTEKSNPVSAQKRQEREKSGRGWGRAAARRSIGNQVMSGAIPDCADFADRARYACRFRLTVSNCPPEPNISVADPSRTKLDQSAEHGTASSILTIGNILMPQIRNPVASMMMPPHAEKSACIDGETRGKRKYAIWKKSA